MAYVRDNITHSAGIDDKVVFSQSLHTWNPKYAPMVSTGAGVAMNPISFIISFNTDSTVTARFSEKVNSTGITKIKLKASGSGGYPASMFVSEHGTNSVKSVSINGAAVQEFTLDVSDLAGEYYICFSAIQMVIYEVTLE